MKIDVKISQIILDLKNKTFSAIFKEQIPQNIDDFQR